MAKLKCPHCDCGRSFQAPAFDSIDWYFKFLGRHVVTAPCCGHSVTVRKCNAVLLSKERPNGE